MVKIKLPFGYKIIVMNYSVLSNNYLWVRYLVRFYVYKEPDILRTYKFFYFAKPSRLKRKVIKDLDSAVRRLNGE